MFKLLVLRFSIAAWIQSLWISSKLRPRTWIALAVLHSCLAVTLFWAYQAKTVPESAIPPVYHAELQPVPFPRDLSGYIGRSWTPYSWGGSSNIAFSSLTPWMVLTNAGNTGLSRGQTLSATYRIQNTGSAPLTFSSLRVGRNLSGTDCVAFVFQTAPTIGSFAWKVNAQSNNQPFGGTIVGTGFMPGHHAIVLQVTPFGLRMPKIPDFGRPVVVQAPSSDRPYLLENAQRLTTFIGGLIASFAALVYLLFAWEKRKREKAEAVLTALLTEKAKLEVALLRKQWEKAEREARESGIVLLS